MSIAVCPPPASLEHLFLGGLSATDMDAIEQHVQECNSCGASLADLLDAKDDLAGLLIHNTESDALSSSLVVTDLVRQIKHLRPALANPVQQGIPMLKFSCSACQKRLSVKEELAGKKVKCPACGQRALVPGKVAEFVAP